ncbi:Flp pilus assembly protein CpaB [Variovorax sp. YR566]|uniref:Flp pilus assembly protein CpaB n=1 Tax=Variovorax sp. YR566 TaxID=3450237 RepID=UPI003F81D2BC
MKNIKAIGLILLALLTGLAAAVYAAGWISRQSGIASNKVVVAAVDIELGSRVNAQMLSTVDWPSDSVPAGSFSDIKLLDERVVKVGVLRGEAIMEGKLAPVGTQGGLSAVIASGKRAMTVRVNDVVGVAGFALPGNYVDVMVNAQQDKGRGEEASQISKTVLEKVLVLAVAQEANRDDTKPKVVSAVTLELSLEDSEKLDLARSVGTLSLVLRNQMDKTTVATGGITKGQLFGAKEIVQVSTAAAPAPARPRIHRAGPAAQPASQCVEVIQHAGSSLTCF